jgi:hypothetical protein
VRSLDASHTKVSVGPLCHGSVKATAPWAARTTRQRRPQPPTPGLVISHADASKSAAVAVSAAVRTRGAKCTCPPKGPVDRRRPRQVRPVGTNRQRSEARPVAEGAVPAGLPPIPSLGDGEAVKVHRAHLAGRHPRARRAAPGRSGDRCRPAQVWFRPLRSRFVADDPHRQQLLTPSWSTSNPHESIEDLIPAELGEPI